MAHCRPDLPCKVVFSGLDSSVAGEIEENKVISNSSNHRMTPNVPLLVPEINSEHLKLIQQQHKEIVPYPMRLSAQCTRVSRSDGHLACVSVKLKKKAKAIEIIAAWREF